MLAVGHQADSGSLYAAQRSVFMDSGMSTPFLHFTKDPAEDITNARQFYHDFNGKSVRIKAYWAAPIWLNFQLWSNCMVLIRRAAAVLSKYTLALDMIQ